MQQWNSSRKFLMPTAYLPPVGYMAWLFLAKEVQIEIHETFLKQTWRNRCRIAGANGPLNLTIPVEKPLGNHTPTSQVLVSRHSDWQRQHWKSIVSAYSKSAYFMYYGDVFEIFYTQKSDEPLIEWNARLLDALCKAIRMENKTSPTNSFVKNMEGFWDLRYSLSPKKKDFLSVESKFEQYFQTFSDKNGFLPNLSIIDTLFHLGPDTAYYLQKCGQVLLENVDVS